MTFFEQTLAALETELRHRERMNRHLAGIPRLQNESSIAHLYDELCDLHVRKLELESGEGLPS